MNNKCCEKCSGMGHGCLDANCPCHLPQEDKTLEVLLKEFKENFPTKEQVQNGWELDEGETTWNFTEEFDAKLLSTLTQAYHLGEQVGAGAVISEVERWHIKKGGYTEMAHQLREKFLN